MVLTSCFSGQVFCNFFAIFVLFRFPLFAYLEFNVSILEHVRCNSRMICANIIIIIVLYFIVGAAPIYGPTEGKFNKLETETTFKHFHSSGQ